MHLSWHGSAALGSSTSSGAAAVGAAGPATTTMMSTLLMHPLGSTTAAGRRWQAQHGHRTTAAAAARVPPVAAAPAADEAASKQQSARGVLRVRRGGGQQQQPQDESLVVYADEQQQQQYSGGPAAVLAFQGAAERQHNKQHRGGAAAPDRQEGWQQSKRQEEWQQQPWQQQPKQSSYNGGERQRSSQPRHQQGDSAGGRGGQAGWQPKQRAAGQQQQQRQQQQWRPQDGQQQTPHQRSAPAAPAPPAPRQEQQPPAAAGSAPNSDLRYTFGLQQDWSLPTGLGVTWLGSSSGSPTRERNVSCTALRLPSSFHLVDAGEGSARQLKATQLALAQLDTVFITHLHGDHCFGIGTLLVAVCQARQQAALAAGTVGSSGSSDDEGPDSPSVLRLVGPPRVAELVSSMLFGAGLARHLTLPLYLTELVESSSEAHDWEPLPPPASHHPVSDVPAAARVFIRRLAPTQELPWQQWPQDLLARLDATGVEWQPELNGRRRFAASWFAKPGLLWQLRCREALVTAAQLQHRVPCWGYVFDELLEPGAPAGQQQLEQQQDDELSATRLGRRVVLLGDTVDSRALAPVALNADLVSHEATFAAGMEAKAVKAQHSTAWMAGQFAWAVQARALVLTHFSARYEGSASGWHTGNAAPRPPHDGPGARRVRAHEAAAAAAQEREADERAHAALQREAEGQYGGLGPVLLATDLLTCHVPRRQEDGSDGGDAQQEGAEEDEEQAVVA